MELTTRHYEDSDAEALAVHLNTVDTHFGGRPHFSATNIREWMGHLGDATRDTRLVLAPDGTIVADGAVDAPSAGNVQASVTGGVAPAWRGRGLGRDMMAWGLDRITQIHAEIAPGVEWVVRSGADQRDESALRLYRRFGLTPMRSWFQMEGPTTGVPDIAPTEGLRVETAETVDHHAVYEVHMEAFQDHFGSERRTFDAWSSHAVGSSLFRPDLSRIAYDGDEIAAYALAYDEVDPELLYIGQVGTRRPWRGRGAATYLMAEVLAAAAKAGKKAASLGVDATNPTGAVAVYERVGLSVSKRSVSYSKVLTVS